MQVKTAQVDSGVTESPDLESAILILPTVPSQSILRLPTEL